MVDADEVWTEAKAAAKRRDTAESDEAKAQAESDLGSIRHRAAVELLVRQGAERLLELRARVVAAPEIMLDPSLVAGGTEAGGGFSPREWHQLREILAAERPREGRELLDNIDTALARLADDD